MPVARAWGRLERIRESRQMKAELDERRFRVGHYIQSRVIYHLQVMMKDPPETRKEARRRRAIELGKRQPDYRASEDARRRRDAHDEAFSKALSHPWHFEEFFGLARDGAGHLFPEPPPEPTPEEKKAAIHAQGDRATQNVIDFLSRVVEARKRLQAKKGTPAEPEEADLEGREMPEASLEDERQVEARPIVEAFEEDVAEVRDLREELDKLDD